MTLRCTIEIVPFGSEEAKEAICRLDISNVGLVENRGFGNEICRYSIKLFRHNNEIMQKWNDEWEFETEAVIPEHNRRDGVVNLVRKACELMENAL